jgi:hypothetical protein
MKKTYDVHFNDEKDSNSKGFKESKKECKDYIRMNNGTGTSYFADYSKTKGSVSIVCNETSEVVFITACK